MLSCGSDVAPGLEAPETLWWEESGDVASTPNTNLDDDDPLGAQYWSVYLALNESTEPTGSQSFVSISDGLIDCEVNYGLEEPSPTEDCTSCMEAWYFVRSSPTVVKDKDQACDNWNILGLEGSSLGFGHDGTYFYYVQEDSWTQGGMLGESTGSLNAQLFLD